MDKRRSSVIAAVLAVAMSCCFVVHAEVAAELDAQGNYLRTVVLTNASVKNVKIWTARGSRSTFDDLNRLLRLVDRFGVTITYAYDEAGERYLVDYFVPR